VITTFLVVSASTLVPVAASAVDLAGRRDGRKEGIGTGSGEGEGDGRDIGARAGFEVEGSDGLFAVDIEVVGWVEFPTSESESEDVEASDEEDEDEDEESLDEEAAVAGLVAFCAAPVAAAFAFVAGFGVDFTGALAGATRTAGPSSLESESEPEFELEEEEEAAARRLRLRTRLRTGWLVDAGGMVDLGTSTYGSSDNGWVSERGLVVWV
jgi:hypothetical protein